MKLRATAMAERFAAFRETGDPLALRAVMQALASLEEAQRALAEENQTMEALEREAYVLDLELSSAGMELLIKDKLMAKGEPRPDMPAKRVAPLVSNELPPSLRPDAGKARFSDWADASPYAYFASADREENVMIYRPNGWMKHPLYEDTKSDGAGPVSKSPGAPSSSARNRLAPNAQSRFSHRASATKERSTSTESATTHEERSLPRPPPPASLTLEVPPRLPRRKTTEDAPVIPKRATVTPTAAEAADPPASPMRTPLPPRPTSGLQPPTPKGSVASAPSRPLPPTLAPRPSSPTVPQPRAGLPTAAPPPPRAAAPSVAAAPPQEGSKPFILPVAGSSSSSLESRRAMLANMLSGAPPSPQLPGPAAGPSAPRPPSAAVAAKPPPPPKELSSAAKSALESKLMGAGAAKPDMGKYEKMLKCGLPRGAVEQAMTKDGVDPKLLP